MITCPLSLNATRSPETDALVWRRRSISWLQLNAYVHSTSRHLREIGIKPGSRVLIISPNSPEYIIALLALWRSGASALPLNIHHPEEQRRRIIELYKPDGIFQSSAVQGRSGPRTFILEKIVALEALDLFLREERLEQSVDPDFEAAVILTSGSTGMPKGASLTLGQLLANAQTAIKINSFNHGDRWLLSLPLWHISGIAIIMRALVSGGTIAVPKDEELQDAIRRYCPTHLSLVPTQLRMLIGQGQQSTVNCQPTPTVDGCLLTVDPGSFKCVLLGGAPVPRQLAADAVRRGWPLQATYGMTETASQIATGVISESGEVEARILPCHSVKVDSTGEICVRGQTVFSGYVLGCDGPAFDDEGWFHTGDLGRLDCDRLALTGRKDNMFISGGENVHPEAIEKAVLGFPGIEAVVAVPVADEEFGHRPAVFLKGQVDQKELREFLKTRLARHEMPVRFMEWPADLPAGMKINRADMRQYVTDTRH